MNRLPISPEEMARRTDEDFNAILQMIEEGSPVYESEAYRENDVFERDKKHKAGDELPETYQ